MSSQTLAGTVRHRGAHAHKQSHSVFGFCLYLMTD